MLNEIWNPKYHKCYIRLISDLSSKRIKFIEKIFKTFIFDDIGIKRFNSSRNFFKYLQLKMNLLKILILNLENNILDYLIYLSQIKSVCDFLIKESSEIQTSKENIISNQENQENQLNDSQLSPFAKLMNLFTKTSIFFNSQEMLVSKLLIFLSKIISHFTKKRKQKQEEEKRKEKIINNSTRNLKNINKIYMKQFSDEDLDKEISNQDPKLESEKQEYYINYIRSQLKFEELWKILNDCLYSILQIQNNAAPKIEKKENQKSHLQEKDQEINQEIHFHFIQIHLKKIMIEQENHNISKEQPQQQ
ncbi:hypothetical protein M0811_12784 [Anaeramoeba ignava]|uniref:Uncharacterized protein n=1 Tax=Anaeramoeba ignava TaxID=1746090 RepID=A0A9Q0L7M0_ANAIG|nr:hypothetical protein M0811_12784 [Anaeramoeba ignava]